MAVTQLSKPKRSGIWTGPILLFFALGTFWGASPGPVAWAAGDQAQPAGVRAQAEEAVRQRQQAQKLVDQFTQEEAKLRAQAESLGRELDSTDKILAKTRIYLKDQQTKVARLERRLREMDRISAQLEPLLDQSLARLGERVGADLPFAREERAARLEAVREVMGDYQASLAEKTRRLLEALAIEARFGTSVEVSQGELDLEGRRLQVQILRLGRVALFALGADGASAWAYDRAKGGYRPVHQWAKDLNQAAEIARRRRVAQLVEVPLPPPSDQPAPAPAVAPAAPAAPTAESGPAPAPAPASGEVTQ